MAKAKPEKSCNDTVVKYKLDAKDVDAAKKQILRAVDNQPVIFMEVPLSESEVELVVVATSLTRSQKDELAELQKDDVMVKRIAEAKFDVNQVSFGSP